MAEDYYAALREFTAKGGKDINEFLKQHTQTPGTAPGTIAPALTPSQPSSVAARLAAADQRKRLGLSESTQAEGNVITKRATSPVTAENDTLQAKLDSRSQSRAGDLVVQAVTEPAAAPGTVFAPTPRRIAAGFELPSTTPGGGASASGEASVPWFRKTGAEDLRTNRFSGMGVGENRFADNRFDETELEKGRKARDNSFVRLNRNTFIPATESYNRSSSL